MPTPRKPAAKPAAATKPAAARKASPRKPAAKKPPVKKAPAKKAPAGKKAAPKKPPAKPRAGGRGHSSAARTAAKAAVESGAEKPADTPPKRGKRLPAAHAAARDSLMIQRLAQNWTWEAIAEEAGLTVSGAMRAVRVRRETAPMMMRMDPVKIVEGIAEGLQHSIGDFEAFAASAIRSGDHGAAVGAKKAANDARERLIALFQATGRMPQDLAALRHLMDVREIGLGMVEAMDRFERQVEAAKSLTPLRQRAALAQAATGLRDHFDNLMHVSDDDGEPELLEAGDEDPGGPVVDAVIVS